MAELRLLPIMPQTQQHAGSGFCPNLLMCLHACVLLYHVLPCVFLYAIVYVINMCTYGRCVLAPSAVPAVLCSMYAHLTCVPNQDNIQLMCVWKTDFCAIFIQADVEEGEEEKRKEEERREA